MTTSVLYFFYTTPEELIIFQLTNINPKWIALMVAREWTMTLMAV